MSWMQCLVSAATAITVISACDHSTTKNSEIVNSVWNEAEGFLLWANDRPVDCSDGWPKSDAFVTFGSRSRPTNEKTVRLAVSDLSLCASFGKDFAECKSGYLDLFYDKAKNEYRGSYSLVMSNDIPKQGTFRAALCVPSNVSHVQNTEATDCRSSVKDQDESNIQRCTARLAVGSLSIEDRAMTFNIRGNTYDALKKYDLAIADYSKVIELLPTFEYAYANRALERCRIGDFSAALTDYDEALRINPRNAYARYGRGVALTRLGRTSEGMAEIALVNREGPETAALYREIDMEPSSP